MYICGKLYIMFNITGKVVAVSEQQTRGNFDFIEFVLENSRSVGGNTYTDTYAFTIGGKSLDSVMTPEVGDVSDCVGAPSEVRFRRDDVPWHMCAASACGWPLALRPRHGVARARLAAPARR